MSLAGSLDKKLYEALSASPGVLGACAVQWQGPALPGVLVFDSWNLNLRWAPTPTKPGSHSCPLRRNWAQELALA